LFISSNKSYVVLPKEFRDIYLHINSRYFAKVKTAVQNAKLSRRPL